MNARLIAAVKLGNLGYTPNEADAIMRKARRLRNLCVVYCNRDMKDSESKQYDAITADLRAVPGVAVQHDPRGPVAFLTRDNDPDDIAGRTPLDF